MAEPRVVGGLRGTKDRGDLSEFDAPQVPKHVSPAKSGERVFVSSIDNLRMCLWEDWNTVAFNRFGVRIPERRDIQFSGGVYRTSDPREIEAIEKSSAYGVDILDLVKVKETADSARLNAALTAADDPAIAEALKVKLGLKEHAMPSREKAPPTEK